MKHCIELDVYETAKDYKDFLIKKKIFIVLPLIFVVIALILTLIIHLITNTLAYLLGLKDVWY